MSLFLMDCNGLGLSVRNKDDGQGEIRGSFPFDSPCSLRVRMTT
jgi:hypothetical protein